MSIKINIDKLTLNERALIVKELQFNKKQNPRFRNKQVSPTIHPYYIDDETNEAYLPFYWSLINIKKSCRRLRSDFNHNFTPTFNSSLTLRPLQKEVKKKVIKFLNEIGTCWLSLYTGGGKTFIATNIATCIKLKTLVICHRVNLINQWKKSIETACNDVIVQILSGVNNYDENADFYIVNAINIKKRGQGFFKNIGFLIVDEVHVMGTERMAEAFQYITPRYCLALSATPYRSDGLDEILHTFFSKNKIIYEMFKEHTVFKIDTGFVPDYKLSYDGSTDWSSVIQSQCLDETRNNLIINLVTFFKDRNFLILSKRIEQIDYIVAKLRSQGEDVTCFKGNKQTYNCESRILVATISKAGVGFDHPKMDALVLASDVEEYFMQYLGRVFRREDVHPIIFDLVDNFNSLKRHYYTRKHTYEKSGGKIYKFNMGNVSKVINNFDNNKFMEVFYGV
jgi:superfamily II DNA or RNA helicase